MKYKFLFLMFQFLTVTYGQHLVQGIVVDKYTKKPLPFANLIFKDEAKKIICDLNGNFSFIDNSRDCILICSYMGYGKMEYKIDIKKRNPIIIELEAFENNLEEVVVSTENNPANEIIRKLIDNKKLNDPENLKSFAYHSYNKVVYDYKSMRNDSKDSIQSAKKQQNRHFFMMESVSQRKFSKPDLNEEIIVGTKVSGFQNPAFASLATDFQPFSFYRDNIKFFDINYLNPISKGSFAKYKFHLEETLIEKSDTIFIISFQPKKNKNFDGLKGTLYINSKHYALQNVIASPSEKKKIDIKIQQKYSLTSNGFWFPEQLNFVIRFNEFPNKENPMTIDGKTYITEVKVNLPLDKAKFSATSVSIDQNAATKDSSFWNKYRHEKLTAIEMNTYHIVDSIGKKKNFDSYLTFTEKLMQRKYPLQYIDIDLAKTISYNKYENLRIGGGFYTNDAISKTVSIGGFLGYGTKDQKIKFGGGLLFNLSQKKDFKIAIQYKRDLEEAGRYDSPFHDGSLFDLRKMIGYRFDEVNQIDFLVHFRIFDYLLWNVQLKKTAVYPKYGYEFNYDNKTYVNYNDSNLNVGLKFAYKEHFINSFHQTISTGTKYPILYVNYSKGIKNLLQANFNYNKLELALEHTFYTNNLGTTTYRTEAGFFDKPLPYGLLFTGEGGYDKDVAFIMKNTFQTMKPYEFLSDKYLNLFISHNFGGLLFKKNSFQPDIAFHQNLGIGSLANSALHSLIGFKIKNKIFAESGLQFNSLIKFNYYNLANIGLGSGIFYRYGHYANPRFNDNIAFKFTFSFSIK